MKVLILTRYGRLGASSRLRSFQYIPYLEKHGIDVTVNSLLDDEYVRDLYAGRKKRKLAIIRAYVRRMALLFKARKYDLLWIEKELFPWLPAWAECLLHFFKLPYVVDYDDAIFHNYDKNSSWLVRTLLRYKIDTVMKHATMVIAGNEYLAKRACASGAVNVEIIPTVVDIKRYTVAPKNSQQSLVVGWIGSPATQHYLLELSPVFNMLKKEFNVHFVAVGANQKGLEETPIEVLPWTEATESCSIQNFDIGIMPLSDSPWERGKCGYKLIQYMACGVPVVASSVGVNNQIIEHGVNGLLVKDFSEWEQMLYSLLQDQALRQSMGSKGRERVESRYSLQVQAPRLELLLHQALDK